MDQRTLLTGDLVIGDRHGGILDATINGEVVYVKDAKDRERDSLRECIPNGTDVYRELAASLVNAQMNHLVVMPEMVLRKVGGRDAIVMEKISGWEPYGFPRGSITKKRDIALFDSIIGNTDRHLGNVLIRSTDRAIVCIDHGLSFPVPDAKGYTDVGSSMFASKYRDMPGWALNKTFAFRAKKVQVTRQLEDILEPEAINAMWHRVEWMIRYERFIHRKTLEIVHKY